jgi:glutathione S-transferase
MLRIWGRTNSINVQKVLWCCHELSLDYERIDAGNDFGVTDTVEYIALNPNRLVPAIDDGDIQLWESNVIVRYLAQKHDHGRLCPADIATRFDAERWMDWQATVFWPALRPLFIALIRHRRSNVTPLSFQTAKVSRCPLCGYSMPGSPTVPSLPVMPFPWAIFRQQRQFIVGMRSIFSILICRTYCVGMI